MPKLDLSKAKKSRLSAHESKKLGVISDQKHLQKPTSVRLSQNDKQILNRIISEINPHTHKKVSESDIIRALISIGSKMNTEKILKSYKDIM